MRQSEFKMRFDPKLGRFTRQHVYGEGMADVFKSLGSKLFGKTIKKAAEKGVERALTTAATKAGEHVGKKVGNKIVQKLSKEKAGDKIVQMLSKEYVAPTTKKVTFNKKVKIIPNKKITQQ